jgi:hypothetical protein
MPLEATDREDKTGLRKLLYQQQWLDEVESGLGLDQPAAPDRVLGVVTEIGLESNAVIVAGFANGDARLLWTSGGGLIGMLSAYPAINKAARELVAVAQPLVSGIPVEDEVPPVPAEAMVRFALLTRGGCHAIEVPGPEVIQPYHPLYTLYTGMNNLLTELRLVQEELDRIDAEPK